MTIFYKQLATDLTDSLLRAERFLTSLIDDDKKENPTDKVFSTIIPTGNVYKKTFKDKIVFNINLAGVKKDNILMVENHFFVQWFGQFRLLELFLVKFS